jgi:uncharacterized membrane protein
MSNVGRGGRRAGLNNRTLVYMAILTAIVFVLQFVSMWMRFAVFSLTFVLIPLVIGSALCGKWAGAWLGFVFGVAVLATGDAAAFLAIDPFGTVLTVLLKGTLAGLISGLVYSLLARCNRYVAVVVAAITAPVVNSGVFVLGSYVFFLDTLKEWASGFGYANVHLYIILGLVGINFLIELGTNCILSPVVLRIIDIQKPRAK